MEETPRYVRAPTGQLIRAGFWAGFGFALFQLIVMVPIALMVINVMRQNAETDRILAESNAYVAAHPELKKAP